MLEPWSKFWIKDRNPTCWKRKTRCNRIDQPQNEHVLPIIQFFKLTAQAIDDSSTIAIIACFSKEAAIGKTYPTWCHSCRHRASYCWAGPKSWHHPVSSEIASYQPRGQKPLADFKKCTNEQWQQGHTTIRKKEDVQGYEIQITKVNQTFT